MKTLHENLHDAYKQLFASQQAHLLALYRSLRQSIEHSEPFSQTAKILDEIINQAHKHCDCKIELMALTLHQEIKNIAEANHKMLASCQHTLEKIKRNKIDSITETADELQIKMQRCFFESDNILNDFSKHSALNLGQFTPGKELSVHISVFDIQHQNIHFLMNSIIEKTEKKRKKEHILEILDDLIEKNKIHFDYEESLMRRYKFPELEEHQMDHEDFKKRMLIYRDKYANNALEASETSMFEIIKMQIEDHIIHVDKKYTEYFNNLGIK